MFISVLRDIVIDLAWYWISFFELFKGGNMARDFEAFGCNFTFGHRWFRLVSFIEVFVDPLVFDRQFLPLTAGLKAR